MLRPKNEKKIYQKRWIVLPQKGLNMAEIANIPNDQVNFSFHSSHDSTTSWSFTQLCLSIKIEYVNDSLLCERVRKKHKHNDLFPFFCESNIYSSIAGSFEHCQCMHITHSKGEDLFNIIPEGMISVIRGVAMLQNCNNQIWRHKKRQKKIHVSTAQRTILQVFKLRMDKSL